MKITEYHGMLGALGGGCSLLGGVIGWSLAKMSKKIPQSIIAQDSARSVFQQNYKLFSYGLVGLSLIGTSTYWLMKIDSDILEDELDEEAKNPNEKPVAETM